MSLARMARVVAILAILIPLTLMLGPFGAAEASTGISDKIGHVVAFGFITVALAVVAPRWPLWRLALTALAIGVAVEIVQGFVGRDADVMDVVADMVGIVLALPTPALLPALRFGVRA